jgi:hypothetical protein
MLLEGHPTYGIARLGRLPAALGEHHAPLAENRIALTASSPVQLDRSQPVWIDAVDASNLSRPPGVDTSREYVVCNHVGANRAATDRIEGAVKREARCTGCVVIALTRPNEARNIVGLGGRVRIG